MNTVQKSMARNGNAVATIAAVAVPVPMPGFLARFLTPSSAPAAVIPAPCDVIDPDERRRLMSACADECRAAWRGQDIDYDAVGGINRTINETFTRSELTTLLAEYEEAIRD